VNGTDVREAGDADAAGLAELLRVAPQAGRMVVAQDRSPDVFARRRSFDRAVTLLVDPLPDASATHDLPAAAVTVATKRVRVAGAWVTAGYVFDLAVAPSARRRGLAARLLDAAERWARDEDAALLYAHVVAENEPSRGVFERAGYRGAARIVTRIVPAHRARPTPPSGRLPIDDWERTAATLDAAQHGRDLAIALDGDTLRRRWSGLPGWRDDDVWSTGRSVLGLWDRRPVVRYLPASLPPEVRALAAAARVASALRVPFPDPPRHREPISTGYLLGGAGDDAELSSLFRAALGRARERGLQHLVVFHDERTRPRWLRATIQVPETYLLMVRPLGDAPAAHELGRRPIAVDPLDM
jgi:ribosomal protein S18 acetylase RimI-like enzyme